MARFEVTPMLAEGIRLVRVQNNIASKELAACLDRSPAYISKLEKGEIKSIEDSELTAIFNCIVSEKDTLQEKIETFLDSIKTRYANTYIQNQMWFINYAWIICKHPVPTAMVERIRQWIDEENINVAELVAKINANEDLLETERNDPSFPFNQWRQDYIGDTPNAISIKVNVEISEVKDFLSGKTAETNYLLAYVIVRHLFRMTKHPKTESLSPEERKDIDLATDNFLATYEFFSLIEKIAIKRSHAIKSELSMLFSSDSEDVRAFVESLKVFLEALKPLGEQKSTTGLTSLSDTLTWDAAFALKVMQLPFAKLKDISFTNKKQLLTDMEMLIQRYQDLPASQRGLESYD